MNDPILIHPDSPQPTRSDAVKNRELLLQTASDLFDQLGVEVVSMSQIAQEAGVGKGTLYRHFTNKAEICRTLLDNDQRDLQNRTLQHARECGNDPYDVLRWFLAEAARFVTRYESLLSVMGELGVSSIQHPAHAWWRQTIRGLLGQMELRGDLDYMADTLYVMLDVHTICYQMHDRGYGFERIVDGLQATLARFLD